MLKTNYLISSITYRSLIGKRFNRLLINFWFFQFVTQLTFEQYRLGLLRIIFNKCPAALHNPTWVEFVDAEPQTRRNPGYGGRTINGMQLFLRRELVPLNLALFKGQLYFQDI